MKDCFCSVCGKKQTAKLPLKSKVILTCPKCSKPILAKRDKTGVTVKAFENAVIDTPP
ncbi:MAG: hypothetical protein FWH03_00740 [Firmicutes bacterium]|nr:hypothetical protein [Bacillota bacterium]